MEGKTMSRDPITYCYDCMDAESKIVAGFKTIEDENGNDRWLCRDCYDEAESKVRADYWLDSI